VYIYGKVISADFEIKISEAFGASEIFVYLCGKYAETIGIV
jgi:hypothetical protein